MRVLAFCVLRTENAEHTARRAARVTANTDSHYAVAPNGHETSEPKSAPLLLVFDLPEQKTSRPRTPSAITLFVVTTVAVLSPLSTISEPKVFTIPWGTRHSPARARFVGFASQLLLL